MARPVILTVDDDSAVSSAISRDLTEQYGGDYRVIGVTSGAEALDVLARVALRDEPVALIVADQRMPRMTGTELMTASRTHAPDAKLLLLTAYADTDVAIAAINEIGLDYYLLKPWDPPEERLYPVVDDLLDDWQAEHPDQTSELRVVGNRWSERAHELKMFLTRNHMPYRWYDVERDEDGERLRALADAAPEDLPLVLPPSGRPLRSPTVIELATTLGLNTTAKQPIYDVCIVGGGPAGLAAAVYAASEGLSTVVVEREAPGGQAGQSAAIENYLGFPRGLSGADLAQRALAQASRFGAELVLARSVTSLESRGPVRAVRFSDGVIEARSVIVASGVSYRRLDAPGTGSLVGRGIFYGATASEAAQTAGEHVFLVGAANSAGQAALNFARHASAVTMLVRGPSLEATMSQYLVARIEAAENIAVRVRSEVVAAGGDGHLETITVRNRDTEQEQELPATWLYAFIGAAPRTDWLGTEVVRDEHGFVITGPELAEIDRRWHEPRVPYALETSVPGVFAAGDVRLDSMKRVASAVGEGAMAVHLVHRYLATI